MQVTMSQMQQRWLWARGLLVHDMGLFRFKGVSDPLRLVSVTTQASFACLGGLQQHSS